MYVYTAGILIPVCIDYRCTEHELRLINGANEREGRLEICINGQFGTVCDDFWDVNDGRVACRQLGYPNACKY